jgi:hypothetical protein
VVNGEKSRKSRAAEKIKRAASLQPFDYLARPAGLEPTTPWFVARCSNPTELRARESELYQKLDEAYPAHGPHGGGPRNVRTSLARSMRYVRHPMVDAAT